MHASESTVLRVLAEAGIHLPAAPPREPRPARPWPEWAELVPGVIWIYDFTHFTRAKRCAVAVVDVVSRYWLATVVSAEESSTQVEVAFTRALIEGGKEQLLDDDLLAELASGDIPEGDDRLPVLVALSDNGPQMTSKATAAFMAVPASPSTSACRPRPTTRPGSSRSSATSRASSRTWRRPATPASWKPSWTGCASTTTRSGCTRASATSPPTTSTTAAAPPSAPPAAPASAPPAKPGLQPAAPYDRITHEPPSAAGYYTRELVHFVRRTSVYKPRDTAPTPLTRPIG